MKKILYVFLLILIMFSLSGCFFKSYKKVDKRQDEIELEKIKFETGIVDEIVNKWPGYESHTCSVKDNIIFITVFLDGDIYIGDAQSLAETSILNNLDKKVLNYYSVSIGLIKDEWVTVGNKRYEKADFSWTNVYTSEEIE